MFKIKTNNMKKYIIVLPLILLLINCFGQDEFELFCKTEINEVNKTVQVGRYVPYGYEVYTEKGLFYLRKTDSSNNEIKEPLFPVIKITNNVNKNTEEIVLKNNSFDISYYFPQEYLIGNNKYVVIRNKYSVIILDITKNKKLDFSTEFRDEAEPQDAISGSIGSFFLFHNKYFLFQKSDFGVFCINISDDNNIYELDWFHKWTDYRNKTFFFLDSLEHNKYNGIISSGKPDNTTFLFKEIQLSVKNGCLDKRVIRDQYLVLYSADDQILIIDYLNGKLLDNSSDKALIDKLLE